MLAKAHKVVHLTQLKVRHAQGGAGAAHKRLIPEGVPACADRKEVERPATLQRQHGAAPQ